MGTEAKQKAESRCMRGKAMTEGLTGWETTRLSKHFILLDFLADHAVYRGCKPLAFEKIWKDDERDALARGLCNDLLEPLMRDERVGPISIADAFWPSVFKSGHHQSKASCPNKHRWAGGEATVDIALYRLVDEGKIGDDLKKAVESIVGSIAAIDDCLGRIIGYPETEFVCVTFKPEDAKEDRTKSTYIGRSSFYGPTMCGSGATSTCSIFVAMAGQSKKASIWSRSGKSRRRFPRKQPLAPLPPLWTRWWRSLAG